MNEESEKLPTYKYKANDGIKKGKQIYAKNMEEEHNTLRDKDFGFFPHIYTVYYSAWCVCVCMCVCRFGLYFSESSCVGIPFRNALFQSIWILVPLTVKLFPHTELLF